MTERLDLLQCTVMPYAWGSRTAIAELTGRAGGGAPEAELWMGAHPVAPSMVKRNGTLQSLEAVVAADPAGELGSTVAAALGPRLPFLLKVLAAAEPLSLQAHPTMEQARAGWADEERRAVPKDAPHRNYKDASHKPELLCALTRFEALSGFRRIEETLRLFDVLAVPELEPALRPMRVSPDARGLESTFRGLLTMPEESRSRAVLATVAACARPCESFVHERALALRLAKLYPGDIGIVSALLLELVHLAPGEAIYLRAGNLHAYIEGTGIELMASSDNVLRGGLTKKHVDVPELLRSLDFGAGPAPIVRARPIDEHEAVYDTPAREFRLSRLRVAGTLSRAVTGPEILLVVEGRMAAGSLDLSRGQSVFVPGTASRYTLGGEASVFRATTNVSPA
jgi:mannose-6-phosphate isomerase